MWTIYGLDRTRLGGVVEEPLPDPEPPFLFTVFEVRTPRREVLEDTISVDSVREDARLDADGCDVRELVLDVEDVEGTDDSFDDGTTPGCELEPTNSRVAEPLESIGGFLTGEEWFGDDICPSGVRRVDDIFDVVDW